HVEGAVEVVANDGVPALDRERQRRGGKLAAGVVDENIDLAEAIEDLPDQRLHLGRLADVAGEGDRLTFLTQLRDPGIEVLGLARGDHHLGPELEHFHGGGLADAGASSGYERDLALEQPGREGIPACGVDVEHGAYDIRNPFDSA